MNPVARRTRLAGGAAILLLALAPACGGGGDDADAVPATPSEAPTVVGAELAGVALDVRRDPG